MGRILFDSKLRKIGLSALATIAVIAVFVVLPSRVSADYVESNLIDDTYFLDAASMSHASIQSFLSARGGALANYSSWSGRDSANVSAAQIIYEAAQDYGISPKVILATLQKEQSLVTAKNPTSSQYNFAMGYGCPDSTGCGSSYSGFYNQVDNAAWQLRYNFERARGNNTWWRNSSSYACGGNTRYYKPGLYRGNIVTFYDDAGTGYKTFKLNGAATASLYCYTPHAYPGSSAQYYSGSYNFVVSYEKWFGSTQPAVVVSSPLRVSALPQGLYTNTPLNVSFDLANHTGDPINVGGMAVAVRDGNGGNHDFTLKSMVIPAHSVLTYSDSQNFSTEGNYTFWITNYNNGVWSDNSPTSADIDNLRSVTKTLKALPTITVQPAANTADLRQAKSASFTFTVHNNSASNSLDLGNIGLAVRAPNGANADLPSVPVTLAAGADYTYSKTLSPSMVGDYTAWVTATTDNGSTWNDTNFPGNGAGVQRRINFSVKSSPTLTQGPALSIATPHVGQQVTASFKVKNFGDNATGVGLLGMAIRDPQGRNVDAGSATPTIAGGSEYTFTASKTFDTPGTYTAWITGTRDGGRTWDDTSYPAVESGSVARKVTFTVLPNPTITVQPSITTSDPRTGKGITASFTLHNYGSSTATVGSLALAARDPEGRNVDFPLQDISIPAGQDYTYTVSNPGTKYTKAGTYTMWITGTRDGGRTWDDTSYPAVDSGSISRRVNFTVKPSPTLTLGPTLSVGSPHVGQQVINSFKVKNFGDASVDVGVIGLAIRDPEGRNVDAGAASVNIAANTEYTFTANKTFTMPGTYTAWVTVTRDGGRTWDDTSYPAVESDTIIRKVQFTVQP